MSGFCGVLSPSAAFRRAADEPPEVEGDASRRTALDAGTLASLARSIELALEKNLPDVARALCEAMSRVLQRP